MALKKEAIAKLAKLGVKVSKDGVTILGVDVKALSEAIAATEEVDFDVKITPETGTNFLTDEELETVKGLAKAEGKTGAERSVPEILAKLYKDEYGIKLDSKDPKEVLKAIVLSESEKAVAKANLTVDEQIKLKDKDLETIRNNYIEKEKEAEVYKKEVETIKNQFDSANEMNEFSSLVNGKFNPLFKASEFRSRLQEEEGVFVKKVNGTWIAVDKDGNPEKDKMLKEVPAIKKIEDILSKRKEWAAPVSGGGAGNGGAGNGTGSSEGGGKDHKTDPAAIKNMSSFKEMAKAEGLNSIRQAREYPKYQAADGFDPNS